MPSIWKLHAALFSVALIYGLNYSFAKAIMPEYIGAYSIIVLRVWGASLLFGALYVSRSELERVRREDWLRLFACAIFGVTANQLMFFKGLSLTSSVNAAVIMTVTPVLVFAISVLLARERADKSKIVGILLGISGAVMLIGGQGLGFNTDTLLGDLLILGNASSYAIYLVIVKPLMSKYKALTVSLCIFCISAPLVLPFGLPGLDISAMREFPPFVWGVLLFIIAGTTFLAYLLNAWTLRYVNPSLVGFYIYLQPVFAMLISIFWVGEAFEPLKFLYSLMILGGIFLVGRR